MGTDVVKLKNGSEEVEPIINAAMMSLRGLLEKEPIAFYEFVMKCRDETHKLFGNTGEVLKKLGLVQDDDGVHTSIRNVVLSAVEGEGLGLILDSPVA